MMLSLLLSSKFFKNPSVFTWACKATVVVQVKSRKAMHLLIQEGFVKDKARRNKTDTPQRLKLKDLITGR